MANHIDKQNPLPQGYKPWWAKVAGHLGGVYPFQDSNAPEPVSLDIGDIIEWRRARGESISLDPVALVAKAGLAYPLGNRTLVEGIRRAPWMAYPSAESSWNAVPLPPHGQERPDPDQFVEELRKVLLDEARSYVEGADTVGIMLSGGMDSRILAGVVRALQEESGGAFNVVGLTWGNECSRDVVYARRVVQRFDWGWHHFPITADTLRENIAHVAHTGAEVSPLHLHAIPEIARLKGIDVILAGSYGDSVGRAEFSGRRITNLRPVVPRWLDRFSVVRRDALEAALPKVREDAMDSPHLLTVSSQIRRREIERQMHYMRRMLQTCMHIIADNGPFYQLFTSPQVFGLIWNLDPRIRTDQWYSLLLAKLPGNLTEIPWARTGRPYGLQSEPADNYSSQFHSYGTWLRRELRDEIVSRVNSDRILNLGIFNTSALNQSLRAWQRAKTTSTNSLDELVAWIASLHDLMERYDLDGTGLSFKPSILDPARTLRGASHARLYITARELMRD